MKYTFFLTGYPGFLASSLTRQLIQDYKQDIKRIYLLVLPHLTSEATKKITTFTKSAHLKENFFKIITGDITKQNLAIHEDLNLELQKSVTHVFHLAALYDLAVTEETAIHINIHGTEQVNHWVKNLSKLERYIYFSTAYVSGTRAGRIYEHELLKGQTFRNHYEETKYHAEVLVDDLKHAVPTTIIRPAIVKGHSKTGETIKFDGLYFMLNLLDHLSFIPFTPYFGKGNMEGNFVPSDYVLEATSYLAIAPIGKGKTYHLTDPNPYTMRELHKMLSEAYLGKTPRGTVPVSLTKTFLSLSLLRKWLQVEKEAMDYFKIQSSYDCSEALADLEGSDITCPNLKDTIEPMIKFYQKYKHDQKKHIVIR